MWGSMGLRNPQGVDDDMHMDIFGVVVPVRVGADKGLVSGEMLGAELLAQLLRPVYGQTVVCLVPWVKADDIMVAFTSSRFCFLAVAEIERIQATAKSSPPQFRKKCGNLPSVSAARFHQGWASW